LSDRRRTVEEYSLKELRGLAEARGISGHATMGRPELIEALGMDWGAATASPPTGGEAPAAPMTARERRKRRAVESTSLIKLRGFIHSVLGEEETAGPVGAPGSAEPRAAAARSSRIVVLFYEAPMEKEWEIARYVRTYFLAATGAGGAGGAGRPKYPQREYLFVYARTPEELDDILGGLRQVGATPDVAVLNLHDIAGTVAPLVEPWLETARVMIFSRSRDGAPAGLYDGPLGSFIEGLIADDAHGIAYGPANRDEKVRSAVMWLEEALAEIKAERGPA